MIWVAKSSTVMACNAGGQFPPIEGRRLTYCTPSSSRSSATRRATVSGLPDERRIAKEALRIEILVVCARPGKLRRNGRLPGEALDERLRFQARFGI